MPGCPRMRATRCPPKALRKRLESMCRASVTFPDAGFYATTYVTTRAGPCRAHMTRGFLANARPAPLAEGVAPLGRPSLLAVREEPGRFPGRTMNSTPWPSAPQSLRGTPVVGREPACCRPRSRGVRIERVCAIGCGHREMACWRERRHPAARASASVQNHRSPFEALVRVRS